MVPEHSHWGLSNNQLKLLALLLMTIDHVGMLLFPQILLLRIIGRLAFPIFAYMIAEGCRCTHSKGKYTLRLGVCALLCQVVYFFVMDSLYQCIFVTFLFAVLLIWLLEYAQQRGGIHWLWSALWLIALWLLCEELPYAVYGWNVDYGFWGVLLPVIIYLGKSRRARFLLAVVGLALLCQWFGGIQWYAMFALIPLALYNGQRGKANIKWLFYLYYPAHLVVLHFLSLFMQG